jgi:hypothetical protein
MGIYTRVSTVETDFDTNTWQVKERRYLGNGKLSRDDGPAVERYEWLDGVNFLVEVRYYEAGKLHNIAGPAVQVFSPGTKIAIREEWYCHGKRHATGDRPSVLVIDPETYFTTREEYWFHGTRTRIFSEGPSVICRDPKTGAVVEQQWPNGDSLAPKFKDGNNPEP